MRGRPWVALAFVVAIGALMLTWFWKTWWKVEALPLCEGTQCVSYPGQGTYKIHAVRIDEANHDTYDGEQLVMLEVNLSAYRDVALPHTALVNLRSLLGAASSGGRRLILRFCYDWDGQAALHEPSDISTVQTHMRQVADVVNSYADKVVVVQGLFCGDWGEMHGGHFSGEASMLRLADTLGGCLDPSIPLAVRTAGQYQAIVRNDPSLKGRLSLFNDGLLGSATDLGTFDADQADGGLSLERVVSGQLPYGGEVVSTEETDSGVVNQMEHLRQLHVSYLNEDYDRNVWDAWAAEQYDGTTVAQYVKAHLGARFMVSAANVRQSFLSDWTTVSVTIKNTGFSRASSSISAWLRLSGGDGSRDIALAANLREVPSGGSQTYSATLPLDEGADGYSVAVVLKDEAGNELPLANQGCEDGALTVFGLSHLRVG